MCNISEYHNLPMPGSPEAARLAHGNRRVPFRSLILRTLYGTGVVASALVAPKMLRLFELGRKQTERKARARVSQSLSRLKADGSIEVELRKGIRRIRLTKRGMKEIEKVMLRTYQIPETAFWDGKWRVVLFDIHEKRKRTRDQLRRLLGNA